MVCLKPRRVLFVDGEMPASTMQERLAAIKSSFDDESPAPSFLRIITPDLQEHGIPDLSTKAGQDAIDQHLDGVELVILDNLSTLVRTGKENEAESWIPIQAWILNLRRRGIAVLLVHHAGKSGSQRGTSKREDVLDFVITLKQPNDYSADQGARFQVHYEKTRVFGGEDVAPFEIQLQSNDDGKWLWKIQNKSDPLVDKIATLSEKGKSIREIADELDIDKGKVERRIKKIQGQGKS